MSEQVRYLGVNRIIRLHQRIMTRMGASEAPLRSRALLESAILRPQHIAFYQGADIAEQATVLAVGISQNQPFLDGNKRTAFVAMEAFLELNGIVINAAPLEIAQQLVRVAERADDRDTATDEFAAWLRERLRPLAPAQ